MADNIGGNNGMSGTASSLRILIVEDDFLVCEMLCGLLRRLDYAVVGQVKSGHEAVNKVRELRPDVVLMDIRLPDMDGIEATRLISEETAIPVVMMTAYETPDLVKRAAEAGASAYLVKPPNCHELERAIAIALARAEDLRRLREANAELTVRNEELDAFAHTVAHDLKDLLARIVGFSSVLEESFAEIGPDELRRHLHTIAESSQKMSRVIDALLLLASVRAATQVECVVLDMKAIVEAALERLSNLIQERQAEIVLPAGWPTAVGYAPWVEEVWVNYISNAIHYGGHPPRVELGAQEEPTGEAFFWVRDNGAGFPPEKREQLFKPFVRLGSKQRHSTGLGLSIVQQIVKKLGGEVRAVSQPGEGSTFGFTLPMHVLATSSVSQSTVRGHTIA